MCSLNDLFVGCPVRRIGYEGVGAGIVVQIARDGMQPNIQIVNDRGVSQWLPDYELKITSWEEPEKVSRLINKQMLNEVSNG